MPTKGATKAQGATGAQAPRGQLTGAQLAALYGVHMDTALRWVKEGLPATKKGPAFVIDLATAVRWVRARDEQMARARMDAVRRGAAPLEASRARKLAAEARIAEVNAAEREGELVPAGDVARRWEEMTLSAREKLLSLPVKALQLGLVAGAEGEARLMELVDEGLSELAARGADVNRAA